MNRRKFLRSVGLVSAATLATVPSSARSAWAEADGSPSKPKAWLFWDLWHLDRRHNLRHCQGEPTPRPEATYTHNVDGLASWPTVCRMGDSGPWRMFYTASWKPYRLLVAQSDDGLNFEPLPVPDVQPEGEKVADNHVFTLAAGSGGGVYVDPVAADGCRFKVYAHQQGEPVYRRALADPTHRWHEIAKREGVKRYMAEEMTLASRDGLHWQIRPEMNWGLPDWHPEPPIFGFWNHRLERHMMTVRPGWGDRRVCLQSTTDFRNWSGPELLLQPDPLDDELLELYGMPVFEYAGAYVGLLWVFHCETSEPTAGFNRFVGPLDCQLAYSYDGVRFVRGLRQPLIPRGAPGRHGCGGIEPSCLIETDDEIRIFSSGSKIQHGKGSSARRAGVTDFESILVHTLRKDGFMYLDSQGTWAGLTSKPLALLDPAIVMNAAAPFGEVHYQLTDLESRPVEGYTLDDCTPLVSGDSLSWPLRWRNRTGEELVGKIVRLELKFRAARIHAFRGNFHFIDAQDRWMLTDSKPIDTLGI